MQFLPLLTQRRAPACPSGNGSYCGTGDCPHCPLKTRRGGPDPRPACMLPRVW